MSASDKFYNYESAQRPTITDYLEHGHVGGTDSGAPYKSTLKPPMSLLIDEVDTNTTYVGEAVVGTTASEAKWRIRKVFINGTNTTVLYADGNANWDNVWDDRESLSYL